MERLFLCEFCATTEDERLRVVPQEPINERFKLFSLFHADTNEQYGRRDNIGIFGLEEAAAENPYQKGVEVAQQVGLDISKAISVCVIQSQAEDVSNHLW